MSRLKQCAIDLRNAVEGLNQSELEEAVGAVEKLIQGNKRLDPTIVRNEKYADALEETLNELERMVAVEKRNSYLNSLARRRMYNFVKENYPNDPYIGLESLLVGTQVGRRGSRDSLDARTSALWGQYIDAFETKLRAKPELYKMFASGDKQIDSDIANALFRIDDPDAKFDDLSPESVEIARIMYQIQEAVRSDANFSGAAIRKLPGYIVRQTHDYMKIRKAGPEEWKAAIKPLLKPETFQGRDPDEFLDAAYNNLARGVHIKMDQSGPPSGFKGFANIGKSMSHERVFQFNDADSWMAYNDMFGSEGVRGAFFATLQSSARKIAFMRRLGPNGHENFNKIAEKLANELGEDSKQARRIKDAINENGDLDKFMKFVDGTASIPPSEWGDSLARWGQNVRASQIMSKLGSMLAAVITDMPVFASAASYRGGSAFEAYWRGVKGLAAGIHIPGNPSATQEARIAAMRRLGVFQDSLVQNVASRLQQDDQLTGGMNRAVNLFFRYNGAAWWTDNLRFAAAQMFSNEVAVALNKSWGDLGELQRALSRAGIDEGRWEIMRKTSTEDLNGEPLFFPEKIRELDDSVFIAYAKSQGVKDPGERTIRELKDDMEQQLRGYFVDSAEEAVINPDAKTRKYVALGTTRGTVIGEIERLAAQFKTFGVALTQRTIGREVFGRGYEYDVNRTVLSNMMSAMYKNENGEMGAVFKLTAMMTLFGYGSLAAKDFIKGREVRNPIEDPEVLIQSILQGGGLGIFGDFFLGELANNRYGHSFAETLAGPSMPIVDDVFSIGSAVVTGNWDDLPDDTYQLIEREMPLSNHFLFRPVMDYLLLNWVQEMLNPGYADRARARLERDTGQGRGAMADLMDRQIQEDVQQ